MTNVIKIENVQMSFPLTRPGLGSLKRNFLNSFSKKVKPPQERVVLSNISLDVKQGEVIGIIGRNGSGKSTLLRVISGIYRPTGGEIKSRGQLFLLAGIRIGFTGNLTGRENAYLYGSILGHSRERMDELMPKIIEFSELDGFIDSPLRTYSSGMTARLGFSVATAVQPNILLIDEVLAVGDSDFRQKSKEGIQEMVRGDATVIIVSHNEPTLREMCDRAICLHEGKVDISSTDINEVIERYHLLSKGSKK